MREEPILRADDLRAWDIWQRAAAVHASTQAFARRMNGAKHIVDRTLSKASRVACAWSGGKDSTCMAHLVTVEMGAKGVELLSEKDDLDYPGEEAYVAELAAQWGATLRIVRPTISPTSWLNEHATEMGVGDDIHGRRAGLSKVCFYRLMEEANRSYDAVMLGLRAEESAQRKALRRRRGPVYPLRSQGGQIRGLPIIDWKGIDVYAYAISRGIELLPLYRCIGFMHATKPWMVRKSWWLPGDSATYGGVAWLRRYYPSLYAKMQEWFPGASMMT